MLTFTVIGSAFYYYKPFIGGASPYDQDGPEHDFSFEVSFDGSDLEAGDDGTEAARELAQERLAQDYPEPVKDGWHLDLQYEVKRK